jgi:phage uncharacterized protein (putative large terminase), C-terminal domain
MQNLLTENEPTITNADLAEIARNDFYSFCVMLKPRFYLPHRTHLYTLCHTLQDFAEDKILDKDGQPIQKLMINLAPRHGKTLTVDMFSQWLFGHDPRTSIIRACYNETLSGRSAKTVRDGIQEIKADSGRIVYSDIFPNTKIKYGDASYQMWSLEGSPFSFLATSPTGTMTGVGCKWGIIDDLVRDAKEAYNDRILEEHWDFYNNTYSSRLETGAKELVVMTRWNVNDLCGKLINSAPDDWHVIKMPACKDGKMLCEDILDYKTYMKRKNSPGTDPIIFSSNYDQEPMEAKDKLYGEFKTYHDRQEKYDRIEAYIDTADEGKDYLAAIVVGAHHGVLDVLDVLFTQDPMEITEPQTAKMLTDNNTTKVYVESNSGGRSFARAIERIMRENGNPHTYVEWFTQTANKMSRILTNSANVTNCLIWPEGWKDRWPQVYAEFRNASRTRKMLHDDIFDAATGLCEKCLVNKFEVW